MKKLITILLTLLMTFSLIACGQKTEEEIVVDDKIDKTVEDLRKKSKTEIIDYAIIKEKQKNK